MIAIASATITLALIFYTIGVFAERHSSTLKASHLVFFYLGPACDTAGAIGFVLYLRDPARRAH